MLHPFIHGKNGGVFPHSYSNWTSPNSGVGMALDPIRADLMIPDVAASPSLLFPPADGLQPRFRDLIGEIQVEFEGAAEQLTNTRRC
jgi:hypothetical protein